MTYDDFLFVIYALIAIPLIWTAIIMARRSETPADWEISYFRFVIGFFFAIAAARRWLELPREVIAPFLVILLIVSWSTWYRVRKRVSKRA